MTINYIFIINNAAPFCHDNIGKPSFMADLAKSAFHTAGSDEPFNVDINDDDIRALSLDATMQDTVKLSRIRPLDAAAVEKIYRRAL